VGVAGGGDRDQPKGRRELGISDETVLVKSRRGEASGKAIRDNLRSVANPPGVEVTDIGEALDLIRQGEEINYQGASGEITFDDKGDVSGKYATWSIADGGSIEFGEPIDLG
jgi:neutral amino acid transport system substrate-binding protein